jgi:hypothetical protein
MLPQERKEWVKQKLVRGHVCISLSSLLRKQEIFSRQNK